MLPKRNRLYNQFILYIAILVSLSGCSVLRNTPEGSYLLDKNIIKLDRSKYKEDVGAIIKQKPNRKILGLFRFHLGVYYLADRGKQNKFKNWFKTTIGEKPVLLDSALAQKSIQQIGIYMQKNGFFNSNCKDSIVRNEKNNTAKIYYIIKSEEPYRYRNVYYEVADKNIYDEVMKDTASTLILKEDIYSSAILQKERIRISDNIRNSGYYLFNPQYITFSIDSSLKSNHVDVFIKISNPSINTRDSLANADDMLVHRKCIIEEIAIDMKYDPIVLKSRITADSVIVNNYIFRSDSDSVYLYKPIRILDQVFVEPNTLFSQEKADITYKLLGDLNVFRFVSIKYRPLPGIDSLGRIKLKSEILLSPAPRQEYKIEAEGTNSGGNLGVASDLVYKNKNIFRGAESLVLKFKAGIEIQRAFGDTTYERRGLFNAYEIGSEVSLNFPRFLTPFNLTKNSEIRNPNTSFSTGFSVQSRPEYYRQLATLSFFYSWRQNKYIRHFIYPGEINYVNVTLDPLFEKQLNDLNDPTVLISYSDQLIADSRYSFIYSNQSINKTKNYSFLRINTEFAGNSIYLAKKISGEQNQQNEKSSLFGVVYAQYLRPDIDYRYYTNSKFNRTFVSRIYTGIGLPYGNSVALPFEKSYFAGGPNDLRAWRSRSVGPGSSKTNSNFERNGEFKISLNFEYRFDIFKNLKGAVFTDIGNVWLLRNNETRPEAVFKFNRFYNEFAIGSGIGARYDFNFFVIRIDAAAQIKDPAQDVGERWVFKVGAINDYIFNLGIGYPF